MLSLLCALAFATPDHVPHIGDVIVISDGEEITGKFMIIQWQYELGRPSGFCAHEVGCYGTSDLPENITIESCVCERTDAPLSCIAERLDLGEALSASPGPRPQPRPR